MNPITFIERCPMSEYCLRATDYIVNEFTPEQAWAIDKALNARWSFNIHNKHYKLIKDDLGLKLALHAQNEYMDALNELMRGAA